MITHTTMSKVWKPMHCQDFCSRNVIRIAVISMFKQLWMKQNLNAFRIANQKLTNLSTCLCEFNIIMLSRRLIETTLMSANTQEWRSNMEQIQQISIRWEQDETLVILTLTQRLQVTSHHSASKSIKISEA